MYGRATRTKEDLIEEVDTIYKLVETDGVTKAADYLHRLLADDYEAGYSAGQDAVTPRTPAPIRRTKMPRSAA